MEQIEKKKFNVNGILKDYFFILAILLGLLYSATTYSVIKDYKQIPSPLFGGDYYHQLSAIYHNYENDIFGWFSSSNVIGQAPDYFPFYGIIVTIFGKVLSLDPVNAMIKLNYLIPLASVLAYYLFYREWTKSSQMAFLGSLASVVVSSFPIFKYTDFTEVIVIPLFLYALLKFFKEENRKNAIVLGIMYGVMAISHSTSFVFSSIIVLALFAYKIFTFRKDNKLQIEKNFAIIRQRAKPYYAFFILAFGIGFLLAQVMWFKPIFILHGNVVMKTPQWTTPDVANFSIGLNLFFNQMLGTFFSLGSIFWFIISICCLLGLYSYLKEWKQYDDEAMRFYGFAFIVTFIFIYSYFILSPLFDINFIPNYSHQLYLQKIALGGGLLYIRQHFSKEKNARYQTAFVIILIGLNYVAYSPIYAEAFKNPYSTSAKSELMQPIRSLQSYLLQNTNVNDVILSSNELAFAINAVSGRKVMLSRRSHNDPFMDYDSRALDEAVILYGNNLEMKKQLIKKYNIKYFYLDVSWPSTEFSADNNGQVNGYIDPILVFATPTNEKVLVNNGIKYIKLNGYVDPAMRQSTIRKFDILIVGAENYDNSGKGLWKDDIDSMLDQVWKYNTGSEVTSILYKVNSN